MKYNIARGGGQNVKIRRNTGWIYDRGANGKENGITVRTVQYYDREGLLKAVS